MNLVSAKQTKHFHYLKVVAIEEKFLNSHVLQLVEEYPKNNNPGFSPTD